MSTLPITSILVSVPARMRDRAGLISHTVDVTLHRYFDRTAENKHNGWFWFPCGKGAFDIIAEMRKYYVGTLMGPSEQYPNARRNPFEVQADRCVVFSALNDVPVLQEQGILQEIL